MSPEELEAKKLQEEEDAKNKAKKKDGKKDAKKDNKGKKKKGDDDEEKVQVVKVQITEVVQKFDGFYEDYNEVWANRDETENYE